MKNVMLMCVVVAISASLATSADNPMVREVSSDGLEVAVPGNSSGPGPVENTVGFDLPFGDEPDWTASFRIQVGGLSLADLDLDGDLDLVVGCYHSSSFPPYEDWHNFIYFNEGTGLEATPSWTSADEVSTGDVKVALINDDEYPDVLAGNGGASMAPSVIYFGSPAGPSTSPGWFAADSSWTNYLLPFDLDHDGDVDVVSANQGNSQFDPYRPLMMYRNTNGVLETNPSWQSAEASLQGFLAFGDIDGDGWEDLAVSKWVNFESGVYRNDAGTLETTPMWTTGDDDSDKGIVCGDIDGNDWVDIGLGHDPTTLYSNDNGTLTSTWTATANYFGHQDMLLCDVDADGDLDLAEVHFSNGVANLYLNQGEILSSAPSWSYDASEVGTALACGDVNGDHLPDLVVGYSGDTSIRVFLNQGDATHIFSDGFESGGTSSWSQTTD